MEERNELFEDEYLIFNSNRKKCMVKLDDILYFVSHKHRITMVTETEQYEFIDSMKNLENKLDWKTFIRIHQSYIVHTCYVHAKIGQELRMTDGAVIPISRHYLQRYCEHF